MPGTSCVEMICSSAALVHEPAAVPLELAEVLELELVEVPDDDELDDDELDEDDGCPPVPLPPPPLPPPLLPQAMRATGRKSAESARM
jgi:hypothetical protein